MFFRFLIWSFIIIMIFRFIIRFILPVLSISKVAQDKIKQMQRQMDDLQKQHTQSEPSKKSKVKVGDYIDYEEIK